MTKIQLLKCIKKVTSCLEAKVPLKYAFATVSENALCVT